MIFSFYFLLVNTFLYANPAKLGVTKANISVQTVYENFQLPLEYLEVPADLKQSVTATKYFSLDDDLIQGEKISFVDLKLEKDKYLDVLYLIKNESAFQRYFSISLMQLDSNRKFLVECHCENVYFSIPPKSAWTRVVRWTFLNSDNNAAISFRNKVTGIDSATMDMSPKLKKLLYKPR